MTVDDSTPETDDEWQFTPAPPEPATQRGGGMLQVILDEVTSVRGDVTSVRADLTSVRDELTSVRGEVTSVREGAQADRSALVDALAASFAKIEVELDVLRDQLATMRKELDEAGATMTTTLTEVLKSVTSGNAVDIPAVVERVVAAQSEANVDAVVAALGPPLADVREAIPAAETANIAIELSRLRQLLIGSENDPETE
jgi:hypothetical protein